MFSPWLEKSLSLIFSSPEKFSCWTPGSHFSGEKKFTFQCLFPKSPKIQQISISGRERVAYSKCSLIFSRYVLSNLWWETFRLYFSENLEFANKNLSNWVWYLMTYINNLECYSFWKKFYSKEFLIKSSFQKSKFNKNAKTSQALDLNSDFYLQWSHEP